MQAIAVAAFKRGGRVTMAVEQLKLTLAGVAAGSWLWLQQNAGTAELARGGLWQLQGLSWHLPAPAIARRLQRQPLAQHPHSAPEPKLARCSPCLLQLRLLCQVRRVPTGGGRAGSISAGSSPACDHPCTGAYAQRLLGPPRARQGSGQQASNCVAHLKSSSASAHRTSPVGSGTTAPSPSATGPCGRP